MGQARLREDSRVRPTQASRNRADCPTKQDFACSTKADFAYWGRSRAGVSAPESGIACESKVRNQLSARTRFSVLERISRPVARPKEDSHFVAVFSSLGHEKKRKVKEGYLAHKKVPSHRPLQ